MPERTQITEATQIGKETTAGTGVAANRKLNSIGIMLDPQYEANVFRPSGNKFPTVAAPGKEWVGGSIEGAADYNEVIWPLSMLLGAPAITTPATGTNSREHLWTVSGSAAADPVTYTVERGSSVRAEKASYVAANALSIAFSRDEVAISGEVIGQRLQDAITLTGSPTSAALIPVLPSQVSVYWDTTYGGIGTTKLLRVINAGYGLSSRFGSLWPLDSAVTSYLSLYEVEPSSEVTLSMVADAAGMGPLTNARAGTTGYLRISAIGGIAEAALTYELRIDIPAKVTDWGYGDADGLKTADWTFQSFADVTAGFAQRILVRNMITAL